MKKLFSLALVMMMITSLVALVGCNGLWGFDDDDDVVAPNNLVFKNKVELDTTQMPGIRAAFATTGYSGMVANAYRVSDRSRMTSSDIAVSDTGEFSVSFPFSVGTYSIEVTKPGRPNFFLAKYVNQADSGKAVADPVDVTTTAIALIASATPTLDYTKLSSTTPDIASYVADLKTFLTANASSTTAVAIPAAPVVVTGLTLNKQTLSLALGSSEKLVATIVPANATNASITWESSDTGVATVDAVGNVTAKSGGTVNVKAISAGNPNISATCVVTITVPVTGISLDKTSLTMDDGTTSTLVATIAPPTASNKNVNWTTSDATTATVSNGVVTALKPGTVTITATSAENSSFSASCVVTINAVAVTGVTLNKATSALVVGGTETLTATVAPANATVKTVTWASSNTAVATVSAAGVVTAAGAGTATITVTTTDGSKTATCVVTVTAAPVAVNAVALNKATAALTVGGKETLVATVTPADATNKNVTWTTSNPSVATVSATGEVTAIAAGDAVITVTTVDGSKTATCAVTVTVPTLNRVTLNTSVTGKAIGEVLIKIEGVSADFTTTATLVDVNGKTWTFAKDTTLTTKNGALTLIAQNIGLGDVLTAYAGFNSISFGSNLVTGAKVTVLSQNTDPATVLASGNI